MENGEPEQQLTRPELALAGEGVTWLVQVCLIGHNLVRMRSRIQKQFSCMRHG